MPNFSPIPANKKPGSGPQQHLFGNLPAVDLLNLKHNEGLEFATSNQGISLLLAASGDLRHLVKTVAEMPESAANGNTINLNVGINDIEFHIVARNIIVLLYVFASLDDLAATTDPSGLTNAALIDQVADNVLHFWHSAFLTNDTLSQMTSRVGPFIELVCNSFEQELPNQMQEQSWKFCTTKNSNQIRLQVSLKRKDWWRLLKFMKVGTTLESARKIRDNVISDPAWKDVDEALLYGDCNPFTRVARQKFRQDGMLLPYSHSRESFDVPNP